MDNLFTYIKRLPLGYSEVFYNDKKYGLNKDAFNNATSFKIYAKELGGNDYISLNFYLTSKNEVLKPCEMPEKKVIHFLKNLKLI